MTQCTEKNESIEEKKASDSKCNYLVYEVNELREEQDSLKENIKKYENEKETKRI